MISSMAAKKTTEREMLYFAATHQASELLNFPGAAAFTLKNVTNHFSRL